MSRAVTRFKIKSPIMPRRGENWLSILLSFTYKSAHSNMVSFWGLHSSDSGRSLSGSEPGSSSSDKLVVKMDQVEDRSCSPKLQIRTDSTRV